MTALRPARPDEIETVRALERASAQRFVGLMDDLAADEPSAAAVLTARIADGDLVVAVEGEDGGENRGETIAGFVMFRRVETRVYVEQIDVLPAFAGRRIGAALLDEVARLARDAGLDGLMLSTFREVPWNAPYYRRLGFMEVTSLTPGMQVIRKEHLARGLDEDARVFMVRDV